MAIDLKAVQETIGYKFENEALLQQAFVRRSYSEENGGQNNEVLEFIGDKALDLAVIHVMMNKFGDISEAKHWDEFKLKNPKNFQTKISEGKFTDIKKDLVQKKALSECMENLGFHHQLIMGKGDIEEHVEEQDSVKEDLFEAIIGAVTLDCNWDNEIIYNVVTNMIDFEDYFNNELGNDDNYVGRLQEWSQKNGYGIPTYEYEPYLNDEFEANVILPIGHIFDFGHGSSRAKARQDAAKNMLKNLKAHFLIKSKYEEAVGKPDNLESIRQVNELVAKGLINKPEITFEQVNIYNNQILWRCTAKLNDYCCQAEKTSKKEAQKKCLYDLLLDLMKNDD